ncbi:HEPN domain-containing protein [Thiospirochaeta perfilievii]|uniref:HEPN domain-containing protein n=1 Tax=Thiospirochaeta perfilievii TaxID=252967 RepID=A0A5C1Q948_9SPIO|nr:HEPN domain-containing protein [Thiospirochaeta perfilievii]QEN04595.1 HEPN domain-containing protein [Thiospirochaeta perfilievii]
MNKLVNEWLSFASKDLKTVVKLIDDPDLTNVVAFHIHQCIEKCFKAVICLKVEEVPRKHNLIKLYGTVRNYCKLDINMNTLEEISEVYIDTRYPSDMGLMPYGSLSIERAEDFQREAKYIYKQIEKFVTTESN